MKTLLFNGTVIDGTGHILEKAYLVVEGGVITQVGTSFSGNIREFEQVEDISGCSLLPGLIDCHVHLTSDGDPDPIGQVRGDSEALSAIRAARNARQTLEAGFTTVRDCGAKSEVVIDLKAAIEQGLTPGPRVLACGRALCITGGHGWWCGREIDGPEEARKAAREALKAGADFLKFIATGGIMTEGVETGAPQMDYEELAAGIREAKKAGKKSAAHAHGPQGIINAVTASIDSIEHAFLMDEPALATMKAADTFLVPTITAIHLVVEKGMEAGIPAYIVKKSQEAIKMEQESFKAALAAGIKIALGTDAGMPFNRHGQNSRELAAMVALGMPPMEAIISGTSRAAEVLGLQHIIGTIAPGMAADLVVVRGNPLDDIALLQKRDKIKLVMKAGQIVGKG